VPPADLEVPVEDEAAELPPDPDDPECGCKAGSEGVPLGGAVGGVGRFGV
jgi:hypothetical protein